MRLKSIKLLSVPLALRVVPLYVLMVLPLWASSAYLQRLEAENTAKILSSERTETVSAASAPKLKQIAGPPSRIIVPRLNIDLPVIRGTYDRTNDSWTLTDTKAQFAGMTSLPNNIDGNTFIYGHNTDPVFAKLAGLKKGDIAHVKTYNGLTFTYVFGGKQFVPPNDTSILKDTPDTRPILTLMTCEGVFANPAV